MLILHNVINYCKEEIQGKYFEYFPQVNVILLFQTNQRLKEIEREYLYKLDRSQQVGAAFRSHDCEWIGYF